MRILVSNDDGIHAEGIAVLEEIAKTISEDVWVCSPDRQNSAMSRAISTKRPLNVDHYGDKRYAVDGTPADSVFCALQGFLKAERPELVLSGVNEGSNIAGDVLYSGTVGAAMEAAVYGVPAMALSLRYEAGMEMQWETARHFGEKIIKDLLKTDFYKTSVMNINFPNLPIDEIRGIQFGSMKIRTCYDEVQEIIAPYNKTYYWRRGLSLLDSSVPDHTDEYWVNEGYIVVTPLKPDVTDYETLEKMKQEITFS